MSSNKVFWEALRKHEAQVADAHDARANPYYSAYAWWWDDENGKEYGPYENDHEALQALLQVIKDRDKWQRPKEKSKDRSTAR